MSFHLLTLFFRLGYIFAITPAPFKINSVGKGRKLYNFLVITLLSVAVVMYLIHRNFYHGRIHVMVVLILLRDASLWSLNCYFMVVLGIWKYPLWIDLINNLESTEYLVQVTGRKNNKTKETVIFILGNICVVSVIMYAQYLWTGPKGFTVVLKEEVVHFEVYLKYFYKYLLIVIVHMLVVRYRGVTLLLKTYLKREGHRPREIPTTLIRNIEYALYILHKTANIFNDMFSWPMFFIVVFATTEIIHHMNFMIYRNENGVQTLLLNCVRVAASFISTIILIWLCHSVRQEITEIASLTCDLRLFLNSHLDIDNSNLAELTRFVRKSCPKFTAADFFAIERSTLLDILGKVTTLLIIIIQFHEK